MQNARLDEAQAGVKIAGRNINNLRYADDTTFKAESQEELKGLLMKVREESKKVGLKLNIQKANMAPSTITSWHTDGETMKTVKDIIFLGSKSLMTVTVATKLKGACSLGKKAMTNLDSMLKSRNIILWTKVHVVKAMIFPVVMYGCESWTIRRLSAEELMLLYCGAGEDSWEFLGQQDDQTSQS